MSDKPPLTPHFHPQDERPGGGQNPQQGQGPYNQPPQGQQGGYYPQQPQNPLPPQQPYQNPDPYAGQQPYQNPDPYARQQLPQNQWRAPQPGMPGWVQNMPPWFPRDPTTLSLLAAGGIFSTLCIVGFCLILVVLNPPPSPRAPSGEIIPTTNFEGVPGTGLDPLAITPVVFITATPESQSARGPFNPAVVGQIINPYAAAGLDNMQGIFLDVLNPITQTYERLGQFAVGSTELANFSTALNIGMVLAQPDPNCPDHARLTVLRADNQLITFGICLNKAVILRGPLPEMGGADLPMGPYFIDILSPFLPQQYRALLGG
jgi:hypothetical protein